MLSDLPITVQQEEKREELQIESHHAHICLLLLDCIRLFFKR